MAFDAFQACHVAPSHHEVSVVAPKSVVKLEAVSPRLRQELIHPNRASWLVGLRFAPDGKRLIAGYYPGGVIVLWDVAGGKQLTTIESGYGYRQSADFFHVSPNWKTVYVSREKQNGTSVERSGKRLVVWDFDGDVRAYDLSSGALRETFKHTPPRGISGMVLSPDGASFATFENLSGESNNSWKTAASLWDVKTRQVHPLSGDLQYWSVYAPDGKTLAAPSGTRGGQKIGIKLFDTATAKEKLTIPVKEKAGRVAYIAFSPDGKQLVGQVRDEGKSERHWLKFWDAATGQETASFEGEKKDVFIWMTFSPDGRTLAVTNNSRRGQHGKLFLFDAINRKLIKTIVLREGTQGTGVTPARPAFSPDGKWLALMTQVVPEGRSDPDVHDLPQPRIHLIDVAAGEIRETLIGPQGFAGSVSFSPDGRTLATAGLGRVLLWDLTHPPAMAQRAGLP